MSAWVEIVDVVRAVVMSAAQIFGGSIGAGVATVSIAVRLAMLPLTLRTMRRMREHQDRVASLTPDIERIRSRYAGDAGRINSETLALYRRRGVPMIPHGILGPALIQVPIGMALYQAVGQGLGKGSSFFWIRDLASPDVVLVSVAAALAGVAAIGTSGAPSRTGFLINSAITLAIAWRLSATVGVYWAASNAVSAAQTLVLRRTGGRNR